MQKEQDSLKESECYIGDVSDVYHIFDELCNHRNYLFVALMRSHHSISWRATNHEDGYMYPGWFIAGMHLPTGDISYHLPAKMWNMLDGCCIQTTNCGPEWDGHTPNDVIKRLKAWAEGIECRGKNETVED